MPRPCTPGQARRHPARPARPAGSVARTVRAGQHRAPVMVAGLASSAPQQPLHQGAGGPAGEAVQQGRPPRRTVRLVCGSSRATVCGHGNPLGVVMKMVRTIPARPHAGLWCGSTLAAVNRRGHAVLLPFHCRISKRRPFSAPQRWQQRFGGGTPLDRHSSATSGASAPSAPPRIRQNTGHGCDMSATSAAICKALEPLFWPRRGHVANLGHVREGSAETRRIPPHELVRPYMCPNGCEPTPEQNGVRCATSREFP